MSVNLEILKCTWGHTGKVFLRILLAGLGGLSNFLADNLPLVVLVVLDCSQEGLALRNPVSGCPTR